MEPKVVSLNQSDDHAMSLVYVDGPGFQLAEVRCGIVGERAIVRVICWAGGGRTTDEHQWFADRDAAAIVAAEHVANLLARAVAA